MLHKNWFLTIFEQNIITILWLSLITGVTLTAATYLIDPIYSVSTEIRLDSSLKRIIPDINTGVPSTIASDYIRQEYFAIDSVNMMQRPAIGKNVIQQLKLTARDGNKLNVNNFINPDITDLLLSTHGQGVTVKWISDTQQFSITGYSTDLQNASQISQKYTDEFLVFDRQQLRRSLIQFKKRLINVIDATKIKILAIEKEQEALRKTYGVADWANRLESLNAMLSSIEQQIDSEYIAQATSKQRVEELTKQVKELKIPYHQQLSTHKNEVLSTLQSSLINLSQKLASASVELTEQHPEYIKIKKQIDSIKEQMKHVVRREFSQNTRSTSDALDTILEKLMLAREDQVTRSANLTQLHAFKKRYEAILEKVSEGDSKNTILNQRKVGIIDFINTVSENIFQLNSLIKQPVSFFRIVTDPFFDLDFPKNSRYFPQRKLTFIISSCVTFFLCFLFILIREFHIETLYRGWQLQNIGDNATTFDIIGNNLDKNNTDLRYIFHPSRTKHQLIRINSPGNTKSIFTVTKPAADYLLAKGNTLLFLDDSVLMPEEKRHDEKTLSAWIKGDSTDPRSAIQQTEKGYSVLPISEVTAGSLAQHHSTQEVHDFLLSLKKTYDSLILLESDNSATELVADNMVASDTDIIIIKSGQLSVSQAEKIIRQKIEVSSAHDVFILLMLDQCTASPFTLRGITQIMKNFLIFPAHLLRKNEKTQK